LVSVLLTLLATTPTTSALQWLDDLLQTSSDRDLAAASRLFQVQNVSLVITYTGLIVAIVMMSSLLWLAANYGDENAHSYSKNKREADINPNDGLDDITQLLATAVKVFDSDDDSDADDKVRLGRESLPSLEAILRTHRQERMNSASCLEFEEFCNLGTKVKMNDMEIGEVLPLVYSALGRSGNHDFRSSLTTFLRGLQGRNCAQKPAHCS